MKMINHVRFNTADLLKLVAITLLFLPISITATTLVSAHMLIDGASWSDGCGASPSGPWILPVLRSKCDQAGVQAAVEATRWTCNSDGTVSSSDGSWSFDIDVGGTGCEFIEGGSGMQKTYAIFNPKKSGVVTVTATATGSCLEDCPDPERTYTAVGYLLVQLPDEEDEDDCGPCGGGPGGPDKNPSVGMASVSNDSINFKLYLGRATYDREASHLLLYAEQASANLTLPSALEFSYMDPRVEVLPSGGAIKQALSPEGLIHIAPVDIYEYQIQCFYLSDVGAKDGNGFYTTNGPAFVTWIVKNPDGASANNRLWITESRDNTTRTFKYTFTSQYARWDLLQPDGLTMVSTWKVPDGTDVNVTNYFREVSYDSQIVKKNKKTYEYISALDDKVLKEEVEGDGALTQITTYSYYSGTLTDGSANKLRRVDYPNGNWVYYKYNSAGRIETEFSAYLNNAPPTAGTEPDPLINHCKVTEHSYTLNSTDDGIYDDGTEMPWMVRRIIVKLPRQGVSAWEMKEISRSYHMANSSGYDETQVCPNPGGKWGEPGNIGTVTYSYTSGDFRGLPYSITHSDGTQTAYSYEFINNEFITTERSGGLSFVSGQETVTITDELGHIKSRTTKAIQNNVTTDIILSQDTYNYTDGSSNLLDPLKRSYDVTDLAGRKTQYRASCCGPDYVIDPDGVKTYYERDELKRQVGTRTVVEVVQSIERSIVMTNRLNAVGSILEVKHVGTNGSVNTLDRFQYDLLGRVRLHTNALNGVTIHTNVIVNSRLCTTNTAPDEGARIQIYCRDGRLEKIFGTASFPVKIEYGIEQDGSGPWREYMKEIKLDVNGNESEWTKTYYDGARRSYKTVYAKATTPYPYRQSYYNNQGQMWKERDPDGVWTLYKFNSEGEREYTVVPVESPSAIYGTGISSYEEVDYDTFQAGYHFYNSDRITQIVRSAVAAAGNKPDLVRTETYVWNDGESTGALLSATETSANGLKRWSTAAGLTAISQTVYSTGGNRYQTNIAPDGSYTLNHFQNGRLLSTTLRSAGNSQLTKTSYQYDAHGRKWKGIDARNGTTTYEYNNAGQTTSLTTPAPGNGQSAQTTYTAYDNMMQAWKITQPDGASVTNEFYPTGLLKWSYGSRTYPVGYGYDAHGRMTKMTNWTGFATSAGARVTTWNYDPYRGWLANKRYPDSKGPDYTYTAGGRMKTREWARVDGSSARLLTTYNYGFDDGTGGNEHGNLVSVVYSNDPESTPSTTYTYDRRGRQSTVVRDGITTSLSRNDAGLVLSESYAGGILDDLSVTNGYDSYLRRTNLVVLDDGSPLSTTLYGYGDASRLAGVTNGSYNANYSYLANSPLVSQIVFKNISTTRMTTIKQYDFLNRAQAINNAPAGSGQSPLNSTYTYNDANQRTRVNLADGSFWIYEYDALGQVKSGKRYWSDWTPVAGQQFEYGFDDIGNRNTAKSGGDDVGSTLRLATYTVNNLNQYTQRTVPGYADIKGLALATNSVTVNTQTPYRRGEYFRKELSVDNGSASVWQSITVAAPTETSMTGNIYVPQTPEVFDHDDDGNLIMDGRWNLSWDGENRLIRVVANTANGPQQRIEFKYDWQGRRISKKVWNNTAGTGTPTLDQRFLYDGWNLIATLDNSSALLQSFVWGTDLSGTMQGAGGVGGLLMVNDAVNGAHFTAIDGNGNVAGLVSGANGSVSARYEHGPFNEPIRVTGAMAKINPFRFSTKYQDDETDWLYYGYRYLGEGRWLSRDPIEEKGGINLYGFLGNDGINNADLLGQEPITLTITLISPAVAAYHGILACFNCREAYKCTKRAREMIDQAVAGFSDPLELQEWFKAAQPGIECAALSADCFRNGINFGKWLVGSVIIKYGIKLVPKPR